MHEIADRSTSPFTYLGLAVGVFSVSTGAIFIRFAQEEAPSLTIAAYRLGIASFVFAVPTLLFLRSELLRLTARDWWLAGMSGLFLALHFATWIYSLSFTSVAISVVMVNTAPLWVALFTPMVTSDRISGPMAVAVGCSVLGAAVIGFGLLDQSSTSNNLLGIVLATMGGIGLAGYLLFGRELRSRHSLCVYATVCYGTAAVLTWALVLLTGQKVTGFTAGTWSALLGVALISQVLGHSLNNWALRFLSSSVVAVALLGEPVLSSIFAFFLFDEAISVVQVFGAALVLIGIYLATRTRSWAPENRL